jgi:hypothetical protein
MGMATRLLRLGSLLSVFAILVCSHVTNDRINIVVPASTRYLNKQKFGPGDVKKCIACYGVAFGGASFCSRERWFPLCKLSAVAFVTKGSVGCDEKYPRHPMAHGFRRVLADLDIPKPQQNCARASPILKTPSTKNVQRYLWHSEHGDVTKCIARGCLAGSRERNFPVFVKCKSNGALSFIDNGSVGCDERHPRKQTPHSVRRVCVELDNTTLLQQCVKRLFKLKISSIHIVQLECWYIVHGDDTKGIAHDNLAWGVASLCSRERSFSWLFQCKLYPVLPLFCSGPAGCDESLSLTRGFQLVLADLEMTNLQQYSDCLSYLRHIDYSDATKVNACGSVAWESPSSHEMMFSTGPGGCDKKQTRYQMTHGFRHMSADVETRKHQRYCIRLLLSLKIATLNFVQFDPLHIALGGVSKSIALGSLAEGGASPCSRGRYFLGSVECIIHAVLPFFGNGTVSCDERQPFQQITHCFRRVFVEVDKTSLFQHCVKCLFILNDSRITNVQLDHWHIEHNYVTKGIAHDNLAWEVASLCFRERSWHIEHSGVTKVICSCQRATMLLFQCKLPAVLPVYCNGHVDCDERLSRCEMTHGFRHVFADLDMLKLHQYCDTPFLSMNTLSFKKIQLERWHLKVSLRVWDWYTTLLSVGVMLGAILCAQNWSLWFRLQTQMKPMQNQLASCLSTLEHNPSQVASFAHQSHATLCSSTHGCCVPKLAVHLSTRLMKFVSASSTGHASWEAAPQLTASDNLTHETVALHFISMECQSSESVLNTGLHGDHNACVTSSERADWLGA